MLAALRQQRYLLDVEAEAEFTPGADPTLLRSLVLEEHHMTTGAMGRRQSRGGPSRGRRKIRKSK